MVGLGVSRSTANFGRDTKIYLDQNENNCISPCLLLHTQNLSFTEIFILTGVFFTAKIVQVHPADEFHTLYRDKKFTKSKTSYLPSTLAYTVIVRKSLSDTLKETLETKTVLPD